jgi:hypothetical protein
MKKNKRSAMGYKALHIKQKIWQHLPYNLVVLQKGKQILLQ